MCRWCSHKVYARAQRGDTRGYMEMSNVCGHGNKEMNEVLFNKRWDRADERGLYVKDSDTLHVLNYPDVTLVRHWPYVTMTMRWNDVKHYGVVCDFLNHLLYPKVWHYPLKLKSKWTIDVRASSLSMLRTYGHAYASCKRGARTLCLCLIRLGLPKDLITPIIQAVADTYQLESDVWLHMIQ